MPKLTDSERDEFLRERGHLARIATIRPDGAPSVVPVWFAYEKDKIFITPRKHSAFLAHLRRDPRVAITVDEEANRYRKVLVEGAADIVHEVGEDDAWRDLYRRIACRYVDDASAEYYLTETIDQPRALIAVELAKAKVTTWRMPGEDEAYSGIWAKRYYDRGTKMATGSGESSHGDHLKIG
jgi:PPOX class probable F420-dependent enzyme